MHRTFEELGVTIDGVEYGHFTGEVQFDRDGSVGVVDIEQSTFQGPPLRLEIDGLLIERSQLRNKYGAAFLTEHGAEDLRSHRRRFELFRALAERTGGLRRRRCRAFPASTRRCQRLQRRLACSSK